MFYPAASLTDNCCNLNVEIVHNLSRHISWYVPDIPSYIVLQICQGLGIIVTDPFLEVPLEEVVTWFQVMGVGWPREVGVTQNEFITWKISAKRSKDLSEQWGGAPSCWWITVFISTPIFLPSFLWEKVCWFSGEFFKTFPQILNITRNYGWAMSTTVAYVVICHTSFLPKFGHQTLNCPSIRYIVHAKIFSALLLCQKNRFCSKVHLDDWKLETWFSSLLEMLIEKKNG